MPPHSRNRHAPLTILLVDDEASFRETANMVLGYLGFQVLEAEDGEHAVSLVRGEHPELGLVIADFSMPGMDGVETLKALSALHPGLKGILCSGIPEQDCLQGRTLENCIYLGKPFCLRELEVALDRVLDQAR